MCPVTDLASRRIPNEVETMMTKRHVVCAVLAAVTLAGAADGGRLPGQLYITKKRLATNGQASLAGTARQQEVHMVWPAKESGNDRTSWTVDYVALFDRPLGDYEVEVKFWDVTKGAARYVTSREQFTRD